VFDGYIEEVARVSGTCLVTVERHRYSVPCYWAKRRACMRQYPERLDSYADDAWIASHARLFDRDQVSYDWQHSIPLLGRLTTIATSSKRITKLPFDCPFLLHLSTAGYLKIRLCLLVKFQPVWVVSFHSVSTL